MTGYLDQLRAAKLDAGLPDNATVAHLIDYHRRQAILQAVAVYKRITEVGGAVGDRIDELPDTDTADLETLTWIHSLLTTIPGSPMPEAQVEDLLAAAGYVRTTGTEWAVASKTYVDGPFDRLDDGTRWSNRRGPFTEEEAREEAAHVTWKQPVHRTVSLGRWLTDDGEIGYTRPGPDD